MLKIGGLINHSLIDFPGKISSVIFTRGCDFHCPFCHNSDLISGYGNMLEYKDVIKTLIKNSKWIEGVVITGGEPLIHSDIIDFILFLKRKTGLSIKIDTNGNNPEMLKKVIETNEIDYIAMDIKTDLNNDKYKLLSGKKLNVEIIKGSIDLIKNSNIEHQFRTTIVPGFQSVEDIRSIVEYIGKDENYILQNFNNSELSNSELKYLNPYTQKEFEDFKEKVFL